MEFQSKKTKDENYPSIKEVMILYKPNSNDVKIVRWPDKESRQGYRSIGACCRKTREQNLASAQRCLFGDVMAMIIRDGVNPIAAHNALLGLREYRKILPCDMPGYDGAKYENIGIF